ncbi:MAG: T9SS type A sorting domain-containing protein [Saprospiraceae bacterium]
MLKFPLLNQIFLFLLILSITPFSLNAQDADGDGIVDAIDIDDDNDGIPDYDEGCGLATTAFATTNGNAISPAIVSGIYGFTLDVTRIDNSFNLTINGTPLTSTEIEFHAPSRTVEFADGTYYGAGGVSNIWSLAWSSPANDETPLIRLKVAADGSVSIFGSKTKNGPLEEMVFVNGLTINPVSWNTLTNTIDIDQIINGSTFINGNIYGYIYDCTKDTDGDGITDNLDLDSDNDGIPDLIEAGAADIQGDGIVDDLTDVDMDGLPDVLDNYDSGSGGTEVTNGIPLGMQDVDGDGIPAYQDLDSDNDGINDVIEAGIADSDNNGIIDQLNLDGSLSSDADNDGFTDVLDSNDNTLVGTNDGAGTAAITTDPDADNNGTPDDDDADGTAFNGGDTDNDGVPNFLDLDSDDDGVFDIIESGNGAMDTFADGTIDTDDNGFGDSDGDGIPNQLDNNVTGFGDAGDAGTANDISDSTNPNSGGNGVLADAGTDADGDGIANSADESATHFGSPVDSDGDGIFDNTDPDDDNDGILDISETGDTDGDGIPDRLESNIIDTDGDGNTDYNDNNADGEAGTDGTGGEEDGVLVGHWNDADEDGIPDHLDADNGDGSGGDITGSGDSDGDGLSDAAECPDGYICPDSDGDQIPDYMDDFLCPATLALTNNGTTTIATEACEKPNGWTYYYDVNDPSVALFAIEHTPIGGNTNPFTASVTITVTADPIIEAGVNVKSDTINKEGNFTMGRDWNIDLVAGSLNGPVNIRFYYDAAELAATVDAADSYKNASSPALNISDPIWFTTVGANYDPTTNSPVSVNNGDVFEFGNLSPSTEDGITYVEMTGLTSLTGGTAAVRVSDDANVSLPVELLAFTAAEKDCVVNLNWATASEIGFDYFVLERSNNGNQFKRVIEIFNAGDANGASYNFTDRTASIVNYYRLKMVDLNGYTEYSKVINVALTCNDLKEDINLYPNPVSLKQKLNVQFTAELETEIFVMYDLLGRTVRQISTGTQEGENLLEVDISDLPPGTYYTQFLGRRIFKKVVIQE